MKDAFENVLEVGDLVVHAATGMASSRKVEVGKIVKINPKSVRMECYHRLYPDLMYETNVHGSHTIVAVNKLPERVSNA